MSPNAEEIEEHAEDEDFEAAGDEEEEEAPAPPAAGEEVESSLEELLAKKEEQRPEEEEPEESVLTLNREEPLEPLGVKVVPPQPTEFVCKKCYLVKHKSQLADRARMLCRDCA